MHFRLWHRLYLAFAGLSIAALLAFAWLQQGNFQRGFLDYLNGLSLERLAEPAKRLSEEYARQGNWHFAQGDEQTLLQALGMASGERSGNDTLPPLREDAEFRPPPRREPTLGPPPRRVDDHWRPPEPVGSHGLGPPPPRGQAPLRPPPGRAEFRSWPGPPPPRPAGPLDLASRLLLLDAQGQVVNGNPEVARSSPAITIENEGRAVGTLLLQPLPRLSGVIDLAFAKDQLKHAAIAAFGVLLGALALAWALARWLLAPIRELSLGTRALAAGNYGTRLPATRNDELGELAADFNRLSTALETHQQSRRQWGADIAHELRTPISILSGEIQALQDGVRQPGPETLASLQAECGRLASLVEDLYALALSDAGALSYRFETLDLAALLGEAVSGQDAVMKAAGLEARLTLPPGPPLWVRADRQRLAQLLGNVLNNARRYTDAPGRVRVDAVREGECWRITVDDTAPGVPAAALERLFDRLYRVEPSRSRAFGGAGLGLSICRNIVTAHGGQIDAGSSVDGGVQIRILLPASEA